MPMLPDPSTKYLPYPAVPFPEGYIRKWPTRRITTAPRWLSTDLRDGNQALVNPMSNPTKLEIFRALVKTGFKEIEVAYPASSEQDYQFCRSIIENGEVPDDVTLQIIAPARLDLLERSIKSLSGCKKAIIHLYNAVSPLFREVVFRNTKEQTIELTLNAVRFVKKMTEEETARTGTQFTLLYCLETFSQTECEFAVELANKVYDEWGKATPEDPIMYNLPATVECGPPNHYADMVEYVSNHIKNRDSVVLSIHPHNDRGTGVAAGELALLAGGDRIEGCLLGNGERTGNVDLISLALNMYSQGVSPNLDFSDLPALVDLVCKCNEMQVPTRYPYAGKLVFSAFAGTHQDAIKKGLDAQAKRWADVDRTGQGKKYWAVPYIPLDPKDLGYGYENLIRVSSQSGKAGTAYVIKQTMSLDLPRRMQVSFYQIIQEESERSGKEMTSEMITTYFKTTYSVSSKPMNRIFLKSYRLLPLSPSTHEPSSPMSDFSDDPYTLTPPDEDQSLLRLEADVMVDGVPRTISGDGRGVVLAMLDALGSDLDLSLCIGESTAQTVNADNLPRSKCATFLELFAEGTTPSKSGVGSTWGVGISSDVATSKCRAVISAASRLAGDKTFPRAKMVFTPRSASNRMQGDGWLQEVKLRAGGLLSYGNESRQSLKVQTTV